jgi:hypothetical protein
MSEVKITPDYQSINAVTDICEPWIEIWSGDEWGESMSSLHSACHTSYGFSDEDCALLASVLIRNLEIMKEWINNEGRLYGLHVPEDIAEAQEKSRNLREYWRDGGNLSYPTQSVTETIDSLPGWMFGEE